MKMKIHPAYHNDAQVTCRSCSTTFTTGSTMKSIVMEVCNNCHPFYTGEQRFIDTQGRVEKFTKRMEDAKKYADMMKQKKKDKKEGKSTSGKSLRELLGDV